MGMQDSCAWYERVDCKLVSSSDNETGYVYTYSHVVKGTPGGADEVRESVTLTGPSYYSCEANYSLYVKEFGYLIGPFENRTLGPHPDNPMDLVCSYEPVPETNVAYQSNLGDAACTDGPSAVVGNPINVAVFNKFQSAVDIEPTASSPLTWERFYNSGAKYPDTENGRPIGTTAPALARLGSRWRSTYDRQLEDVILTTPTGIERIARLHRHTGQRIDYIERGARYESSVGSRGVLSKAENGWRYRSPGGETEIYDGRGRLTEIRGRAGLWIRLTYSEASTPRSAAPEADLLIAITDQHGRRFGVTYDAASRIDSVYSDDGKRVQYAYDEKDGTGLSADLAKVTYPDGSSLGYLYNESENTQGKPVPHALTGIVDENNMRFATYGYDYNGEAGSSEHALGAGKVFMYSLSEDRTVVHGPTGAKHTYTFDTVRGSRRVVSVDQPGGAGCGAAFSRIEYDKLGFVSSAKDFDGSVTRYSHDAEGNETERVEAADTPLARVIRTEWHKDLLLPTRVLKPGYEERRSYDEFGNLTELDVAGGIDPSDPASPRSITRKWRTTYGPDGQPMKLEGPRSDTGAVGTLLSYAYRESSAPGCATGGACDYRKGDLWKIVNALGQAQELLRYDPSGRVLAQRDANGVITELTYSARGRLASERITDREGISALTRYTYTPSGQVASIEDADNVVLTFQYDEAQRLVGVTDAIGNRVRYQLDAAGQRTREDVLDKDGSIVRHIARAYDVLGRVATQTDAYGIKKEFTYDEVDRPTGSTDALSHRSSAAYDALGRLREAISDVDGASATIVLDHDPLDHVSEVTDPKHLSTRYLTTGLGDASHTGSPDTGEAWRSHDVAGEVSEHQAAGGVGSYSVVRDALRRPLSQLHGDPTLSVYLQYDVADPVCRANERYAIGRLSKITDGSGSTAYCYDAWGRVTSKYQNTRGTMLSAAHRYTRGGRMSGSTLPDGSTMTWQYDVAGNVNSIDVALAGNASTTLLTAATWSPFGGPTGWTYGNGRTLARTFDANGRPTGVSDMAPGGLRHTLRYDEVGHIVGLDTPNVSLTYTYDGLDRLLSEAATDGGSTRTYRYDTTGNRLSVAAGGVTDSYQYAAESHHLTTADARLRRYDAAGNTVAIDGLELVYDATGRLASVKDGATTAATYIYNGRGERVMRTTPGSSTVTLYDEAGHWIGNYDVSGKPLQQAIWLEDYPVGLIADGRVLYIEPDHLGTPRAVVDPSRNDAVWRWNLEGEAFGADAADGDADGDGKNLVFDLRLPGQQFDAVTGLHYNYYRDYDPTTGRYVQSDPIGLTGGISTYTYAGSSPLAKGDPTGLVVKGTFSLSTGELVLVDLDRPNQSYLVYAKSGGRFTDANTFRPDSSDTIPLGKYDILDHRDSTWFRLDARDSYPFNDVHEPTGRDVFRLHPGKLSLGCITVNKFSNEGTFFENQVAPMLRNTRPIDVTDFRQKTKGFKAYPIRYGDPVRLPTKMFGTLEVIP